MSEPVLEALPDAVVIAGPEGTVLASNHRARVWLQLTGDGVGEPLGEVLRLVDRDGCSWVGYNQPYAGLPSRRAVTEQSWLLPDGSEVLVNAALVRPARGAAVEQVAVCLRSGRGRKALDRDRSDLVATVAHELRSPLTGVKGFVGTLLSRWDRLNDSQKQLMLRTVQADADRLTRLITELLDVARLDTGRMPMYPRRVDATDIVTRVVELVRAGTTREIELDAEQGASACADPDKLAQVVTNLVDNAVRHGEGTVRVSTRAEAGRLVLVVDDEGEGIAEENRKRVFTKFWRHGVRGGSGLGMYLVGGLTKVHGGSVDIGTSPAGGARITVHWPDDDPLTGS